MDDQRQALDLLLGHLLGHLDEGFDHDAWHGGTLWGAIRGMSREDAEWRPSSGRHNIREIVVHCAYWKYIVRRRLTGDRRRAFPLEGSDWFLRPGKDAEGSWEGDRLLLREEHEKLRKVVADMTPADLRTPRGKRDPIREIRGVADHDIYHTGQIRLLRVMAADG